MGKTGLYLKILILVIVLIGVFAAIRGLTTQKVEEAFQALGVEPSAGGHPSLQAAGGALAPGETRRTLCQTRVHAIRFPDGKSIVERKDGMKLDWVAEEAPVAENTGKIEADTTSAPPSQARSLNYLEIEKWFSQHCQYVAGPAPAGENLEPSNEPVKFVLFEFVDKSQWEVFRSGDVFSSAADPKDRFVSPDLAKAVSELRAIAGFPVDSKDR
jgi:hypothetical protein